MEEIEEKEELDQCMACRITGTVTSFGIAAYCLFERSKIPTNIPASQIKSRARLLNGLALGILNTKYIILYLFSYKISFCCRWFTSGIERIKMKFNRFYY